jgi:MFS-type transporter involved in bile tolerance (Atg22 family)
MGPIVFGTVSRLTGGNQRVAILAVGLMFVIGLAVLARVSDPTRRSPPPPSGPPGPR